MDRRNRRKRLFIKSALPKSKKQKLDETVNDNDQLKMDKLPVDILYRIFQLIPVSQWPSLESVNKNFQSAVHESWRCVQEINLDVHFVVHPSKSREPGKALESILKKLLLRSPNLKSMFGEGFRFYGGALRLLAQFTKLQVFNTMGIRVWASELANFIYRSTSRDRLSELDVSVLYENPNELTSSMGAIVGRPSFNLGILRLELHHFNRLSDFDFINPSILSALKKLDLFGCDISSTVSAALINRCVGDHLEELSFTLHCPANCYDNGQCHGTVTNEIRNLTNLRVLKVRRTTGNFDGVTGYFNELFEYFGRTQRLTELRIMFYCNESFIRSIARHMKHLSGIQFSAFDRDSCIELLTQLQHLKYLHIGNNVGYFSNVFSVLSRETETLGIDDTSFRLDMLWPRLSKLKSLAVIGGCLEMNRDQSFSNYHLERLLISGDTEIDGDSISRYITPFRGLRVLHLAETSVVDDDLEAIAGRCQLLEEVDLDACERITIRGVGKFMDQCPKLKRVQVPLRFLNSNYLKVDKYKNINFFRK